MYRIHPICEQSIRPHIGRPVCAIMQDGSRYFGVLNRIEGEQIILNENLREAGISSKHHKGKKNTSKARKPMKTSGLGFGGYPLGYGGYPYGGYGYGYPRVGFGFGRRAAIGLASIALLFALI